MEPQTIIPYITTAKYDEVVDFTKRLLGGEEVMRVTGGAGGIHCEVRVGDSRIMVGGGGPRPVREMPTMLHVYLPDVDAVFRRSVEIGAKPLGEPRDQEYGDRDAVVEDAAGNQWCLATSKSGGPPEGMRTVTMYLHPHGTADLIGFVERAFDAQTLERHESPDGVVQHAKVKIRNTIIEMGEAHGLWQPMPTMIYFIVDDVDADYERTLQAGATSVMRPSDRPQGERMAGIADPSGNEWYFAAPLAR